MERLINNPHITITKCTMPLQNGLRSSAEIKNSVEMRTNCIKRCASETDPNSVTKQPRLEDSECLNLNQKSLTKNVVDLMSSDDDGGDGKSKLMTITSSKLQEYIIKLCKNSRYLDKIIKQQLFKHDEFIRIIDGCKFINIGDNSMMHSATKEMVISVHGIRMMVQNVEFQPVRINIHMENIVKISYYFSYYADPNITIIITTDRISSAGIQYLLSTKEDNNCHYNAKPVKITWGINATYAEYVLMNKVLKKLPESKIEFLTFSQFHSIIKELKFQKNTFREENKWPINPDQINIIDDQTKNNSFIISVLDYEMLTGNSFVNSNHIEFYLNYWHTTQLCDTDRERTAILNTHFYNKLTNPCINENVTITKSQSQLRHWRVQKWTKNVNIFEKDFIFVPIHDKNHWYMLVICYPYLTGKVNMKDGSPLHTQDNQPDSEYQRPPSDSFLMTQELDEADPSNENLWLFDLKTTQNKSAKIGSNYYTDVEQLKKQKRTLIKQPCIIVFDSLNYGYCRAKVAATIREWLDEEYQFKYNGKKRDFSPNVVKAALVNVPQQPNFVDCGFFVMNYFEKFFEKPIVDYEFPIYHLENWFPIEEVSKNCQKRAEFKDIILTKIAAKRKRWLPPGMALPVLDFRESVLRPQFKYQSNLSAMCSTVKPMSPQNVPRLKITRDVRNGSLQCSINKEKIPEESDKSMDGNVMEIVNLVDEENAEGYEHNYDEDEEDEEDHSNYHEDGNSDVEHSYFSEDEDSNVEPSYFSEDEDSNVEPSYFSEDSDTEHYYSSEGIDSYMEHSYCSENEN